MKKEEFRPFQFRSRSSATEHAKPPRAVFLPLMIGHHFGVPFHKHLQRKIILVALDFLTTAKQSGEVKKLFLKWAEARGEGIEIERRSGLETFKK